MKSREQYGSTPLLYGQYYDAPYDLKSEKYWAPLNGKYVHASAPADAAYRPEGKMLFPRMWSSADPRYVDFYESYTQGKGTRVKGAKHRKPTFGANLSFFFDSLPGRPGRRTHQHPRRPASLLALPHALHAGKPGGRRQTERPPALPDMTAMRSARIRMPPVASPRP